MRMEGVGKMNNRATNRRGSVYLLVLSVALLLTITGVGSILAVRSQRQAAEAIGDAAEARLYAQSGIEMGLLFITEEPSWRTARAEGSWVANQVIGNGKFSLEANDLGANGDLALSSDSDSVLLTATGFKGDARHKLQVKLQVGAGTDPLECLQTVLMSHADITFNGANVSSNGVIGSNGDAIAISSMVASQVQVSGATSGGMFSPFPTSGVAARDVPAVSLFDAYTGTGTQIAYADLPGGVIEEGLLSPGVNPYGGGTTNTDGIYIIDCAGNDITIQNCRIVGTLVLLDVGAGSEITGQLRLEPEVSNYPSLLVQGSIAANLDVDADLDESDWGFNFNPPHTPLDGASNGTSADVHPSIVKGLVYISGDLSTSNNPEIEGAIVVGGTFTAAGNLTLSYDPVFFATPPPGFTAATGGAMEVLAGSWEQVVD